MEECKRRKARKAYVLVGVLTEVGLVHHAFPYFAVVLVDLLFWR
jgi:hypothetical protein